VDSIFCFTNEYCPKKGAVLGFDNQEIRAKPKPYYRCEAKTLEQMQPCILNEDKDLKKYGIKILVKGDQLIIKAWDPKKVLVQRMDRDEQIDGSAFEHMEV
jgi:hypothetical protein